MRSRIRRRHVQAALKIRWRRPNRRPRTATRSSSPARPPHLCPRPHPHRPRQTMTRLVGPTPRALIAFRAPEHPTKVSNAVPPRMKTPGPTASWPARSPSGPSTSSTSAIPTTSARPSNRHEPVRRLELQEFADNNFTSIDGDLRTRRFHASKIAKIPPHRQKHPRSKRRRRQVPRRPTKRRRHGLSGAPSGPNC